MDDTNSYFPFSIAMETERQSKKVHDKSSIRGMVVICFKIIPCFMMLLVYFHLFLITRAHSRQIAAQGSVKLRYSGRNIQNQTRQGSRERSNLKVFASVALLFIFCWLLSAYRGFCDMFNLCTVTVEFVLVSRILLFLNSSINVVVYSFLRRDIRAELERLFRCRVAQESLNCGMSARKQFLTMVNFSLP